MKFLCYLAALTLLLVAVLAVQTTTPEEEARANHKIDVECQKETGVSDEILTKSLNRQWEDDPKLKQHVLCVCKKRGLVTESGELVVDAWRKTLRNEIENDEAEKVVKECVVKKDTPEETTFNALKCVQEKLFAYSLQT